MPTVPPDSDVDRELLRLRGRARRGALPLYLTVVVLAVVLVAIALSLGCTTFTPSRPTPGGPSTPPQPGQALDVQVADVTGPPIANAVVTIQDNQNKGRTATANALGRALLSGLIVPSGFTICAKAEGYVESCVGVDLVTSTNTTIRLAKVVTVPPPPVESLPAVTGDLRPSGRSWVTNAGPFRWRGVTSFGIVWLVAEGREAEATARLADLAAEGFNVLRVLTMAKHLFVLTPAQGRAALPRALELAKAAGFYVEVVGLADTKEYPIGEMAPHLNSVARIAKAAGNAVLEGANEIGPVHETQRPEVVALVRGFVPPPGLVYAPGSVHGGTLCKDESLMTPGQLKVWREEKKAPYWDEIAAYARHYGTSHLKRGGDPWNRTRRVRELEMNSGAKRVPWIDDEPIGFAEVAIAGKRDTNEHAAYLQGVLSVVMDVGSTFHTEAGLRSQPFGPKQRAAAKAFIEGTRVVPDNVRLTFKNHSWADSPVKDAKFADKPGGTVVRVYSGVSGSKGITVALGLTGDPGIVWQGGWRVGGVIADRPGVRVYEIAK